MSKYSMEEIEIEKLKIWKDVNARKTNIGKNIDELAENIKRNGLQFPLLVKKDGDEYKVFVGQRRLMACSRTGESLILCKVYDDIGEREARILSLSENLYRLSMETDDKIEAVTLLLDQFGGDKRAVADALGVTVQTIHNYLGYAGLPDEIKDMVRNRSINASQALKIYRKFPADKAKKVAKLLADIPLDKRPERRNMYTAIADAHKNDTITRMRKQASNMASSVKYTIMIPNNSSEVLEDIAKVHDMTKEDVALDIILDAIERREQEAWV